MRSRAGAMRSALMAAVAAREGFTKRFAHAERLLSRCRRRRRSCRGRASRTARDVGKPVAAKNASAQKARGSRRRAISNATAGKGMPMSTSARANAMRFGMKTRSSHASKRMPPPGDRVAVHGRDDGSVEDEKTRRNIASKASTKAPIPSRGRPCAYTRSSPAEKTSPVPVSTAAPTSAFATSVERACASRS